MEGIVSILLLLVVAFCIKLLNVVTKKTQYKQGASEEWIYDKATNLNDDILPYKSKYILTKNEYLFYKELKKITDRNNLLICPKVGLKDLFDVTDKVNYMSWFGKIAQKHIDFLVCDGMLRPKYAIEVDDNSHQNREESDIFKNSLFKNSNIDIIRIKAQREYSEEYILRNLDLINNETDVDDIPSSKNPWIEINRRLVPEEDWIYEDKKKDLNLSDYDRETNPSDAIGKKESIWNKKIF